MIQVVKRSRPGGRLALFTLLWLLVGTVLPVPAKAVSDLRIGGFTVRQAAGGGEWEIRAEEAAYRDDDVVLLQRVSASMTSGGVVRLRVDGKSGTYESDRMLLSLRGGVTLTSSSGSRLTARRVTWEGKRDLVLAAGGVRLLRGGLEVEGDSARYRTATGETFVTGGVRSLWRFGP